MNYANNFVKLATAHLLQKTLYNAGLDPHNFGKEGASARENLNSNLAIYKSQVQTKDDMEIFQGIKTFYRQGARLQYDMDMQVQEDFAELLAAIEFYLKMVINIMVEDCNIRTFKPQSAFYEQFGPLGLFMLSRICDYFKKIEKEEDKPVVNTLDCKRGDISTTQAAYFIALLTNLAETWGIDYSPYDFDIVNVTPWMGPDVLVLKNDKKEDGLGLQLMRKGKCLIVVNKTSNPSGPHYQELVVEGKGVTLQMCNVDDLYQISREYGLESEGLSTIGMVVGSTHKCDGSIRKAFPSSTLLVPGFGAQGGKFDRIMPELIPDGKWAGLGAIFSSSRGSMFPFMKDLGGSGEIKNLRDDMIKAVTSFRASEKKAYEEAGLAYPFA